MLHPQAAKSPTSRFPKRTWALSCIGLVLLVGSVAIALRSHKRAKHEELVVALAADPPKMAAAVQSGEVSSHEANMATLNSETQKLEGRVHDYFALPPGKPRQDYLDRLIDRVQQDMNAARAQAMSPPPATIPSRQEVVGFVEDMPPALKSQIAEFMKAMVDRIKQRGISMPGR